MTGRADRPMARAAVEVIIDGGALPAAEPTRDNRWRGGTGGGGAVFGTDEDEDEAEEEEAEEAKLDCGNGNGPETADEGAADDGLFSNLSRAARNEVDA